MLAEVKVAYAVNLRDVVGMLRRLADKIERGEEGVIERAVCVLEPEDGHPRVFGWGEGRHDLNSAIGLLQLGQAELARMRLSVRTDHDR